MASILILLIYLAFISMGLPDALLGAAWPSAYTQMGVPVSFAGIVTVVIASGTVISSLLSDRLLKKFGTGVVTLGCTLLTAVALFGFSISTTFIHLCLWAVPYGLGAGSIDAALNNFVALKYKSRHMSWIHFFWGVGATAGPYMMGALLTGGAAWTQGYRLTGIIQVAMTLCLFLSLPLFKKNDTSFNTNPHAAAQSLTKAQALKLPGAKVGMLAFFCYSGVESTAGLWASSYMTLVRGVTPDVAAKWASIFYLGITIGRFLCGFIADRIGDKNMIRLGQTLIGTGALIILIPGSNAVCFAGLIMVGLGCAPVYPSLLHATPTNFGAQNSQTIMGLQMACAYTGSTLMPPAFGFLSQSIGINWYPVFLLLLMALMFFSAEGLNRAKKHA